MMLVPWTMRRGILSGKKCHGDGGRSLGIGVFNQGICLVNRSSKIFVFIVGLCTVSELDIRTLAIAPVRLYTCEFEMDGNSPKQ